MSSPGRSAGETARDEARRFPRGQKEHELTRRAAHLDFAAATLLIPYNIALYGRLFGPADYAGYLNAPEEMRRALLEKVLVRVGISARAAGALVADRAEFVNGDDRAHADGFAGLDPPAIHVPRRGAGPHALLRRPCLTMPDRA
ncbi:hypothetical protein ACWEPC_34540 [Nonomuraea sp. NPDC004297]